MAISRQVGAMALLLALAACGKGGKDGNLAALDDQLTNNAADPAMRASCVEFVLAGLYATDRISRAQRHGRMLRAALEQYEGAGQD